MGLPDVGQNQGQGMSQGMRDDNSTDPDRGRAGRGYSFQLVNIDCLRDSSHFNVVMQLDRSVAALLPYLAATLPNCTYVHGSDVINVMDAGHIVGIYPERITITDVTGPETAEDLCQRYFRLIEKVRAAGPSIEPVFHARPERTVLEIYRSLPGTNCGQCGLSTCMAFAAALYRGEAAMAACEPLPTSTAPGTRSHSPGRE